MTGLDRTNPKAKGIVEAGYDRIAERYAEWTGETLEDERERYATLVIDRLPASADVLDLGCATGVPATRAFAQHFAVTGVDVSARNIALARQRVPNAKFVQADFTTLTFPPRSFDAVVAFYSIIHVPREEHAHLLGNIATWLRPGGLFVATMGIADDPGTVEEDWLGTPMYFSSFGARTNQQLVSQAGLELIGADEITSDEDGAPVTFLWVVAKKPVHEPTRRGTATGSRAVHQKA